MFGTNNRASVNHRNTVVADNVCQDYSRYHLNKRQTKDVGKQEKGHSFRQTYWYSTTYNPLQAGNMYGLVNELQEKKEEQCRFKDDPSFEIPNEMFFSSRYLLDKKPQQPNASRPSPHDRGIIRAMRAKYKPPSFGDQEDHAEHKEITSNPKKTLFIGRLALNTTEDQIQKIFQEFGKLKHVYFIRDIVTGIFKGYGFVEFEHGKDCDEAYRRTKNMCLNGSRILVDYERGRNMKGWVPRRFGGGLGGKIHSGQMRFGGRYCPFKFKR